MQNFADLKKILLNSCLFINFFNSNMVPKLFQKKECSVNNEKWKVIFCWQILQYCAIKELRFEKYCKRKLLIILPNSIYIYIYQGYQGTYITYFSRTENKFTRNKSFIKKFSSNLNSYMAAMCGNRDRDNVLWRKTDFSKLSSPDYSQANWKNRKTYWKRLEE